MKDKNNEQLPSSFVSELDLLDLFRVIYQKKGTIVTLTSIVSILGVLYSLYLPNIYNSSAVLAPVNTNGAIAGALNRYSGLAALSGISIPSSSSESNTERALAKLTTLSFFENNILPNIFLPDLMAVKSWDRQSNRIIYNPEIYDEVTNTWVKKLQETSSKTPTPQSSYSVFKSQNFGISKDKKNGFITITIKHQSPYIAKVWAELIINQINDYYRDKDKTDSEKSLSYLNRQIGLTNLSEIKLSISDLIKEETKKLALIEANKFYVFEYIDPPAVMESKFEPDRASICIIIALIGGMFSVLFVLTKHYFFNRKAF